MALVISIIVILLLLALWACLKVGSDADDQMGYDYILEEKENSDGIR